MGKMDLQQARAECQRWFDYNTRQKEKCAAVQKIAADRRAGVIDEAEGRRRLRHLDSGVTVYDGANLEKAVRVLMEATRQPAKEEGAK